jgi:CheY-like chemotaxis protein
MVVKILIVEDESIVALDLEQRLTILGYKVVGNVYSGLNAIKFLIDSEVDLILMDICLKGKLNGIETAIIIRERLDIPIIYASANSDLKTHELIKKTEPYEYLIKPFEDNQLQNAIINCFKLQ